MNETKHPSRLLVDITFWATNLGVIAMVALHFSLEKSMQKEAYATLMMSSALVVFSSLIIYFFAIGWYAQKRGRSALVWGGGSFIASPISVWISYIASFFINTKKCPYCTETIKEEAVECPCCASIV